MGSLGCGLCDKVTELTGNLTPEDIKVIKSCLSAQFNTQISNIFKLNSSNNISLCSECAFLLREMERVKVLVDLVNSHLDDLVSKFKGQFCGGKPKSLQRAGVENNCHNNE